MKKLILLALTTIFSFNLYSQIYWEKHPDNPVLTPGSSEEWDEKRTRFPIVIYYDSTYHMWYSGRKTDTERIGYATSPDGITWTKHNNNPVLDVGPEGAWDDNNIFSGSVLVIDSIFHMWYMGHTGPNNATNYQIGHATSPDGINWTKDPNNPVLSAGLAGSWDVYPVSAHVVYTDSSYHMWYTGWDGSSNGIGYATSPDGTTWAKDTNNPVLDVGPEGAWDVYEVIAGSVLVIDSTHQMWYSGGEAGKQIIGYATSEDGKQWVKYGQPVLRNGPAGSWDAICLYYGSSVLFDSTEYKYKMWYAGKSPIGSYSIGYAESDARRPYLWVKNKTLVDNTDTLVAQIINKEGIIHLVPYGISPVIDSINKYTLASTDVLANKEVNVPLTYLPVGQYMVVAVSNMEFVCPNPFLLQVVPDASLPELTIAEDTVSGANITATSTKDGILYLLNTPLTPDLSLVRNPNFLIDSLVANSDVQVEFPTSGLIKNVSYWLYAVDIYGQFSERATVRVEQGVGVKANANAGIRIYPNPTNEILTIETGNVGQHSIEINSLNGQLIYREKMEGNTHQIDLSSFPRGAYLITIRSKEFVTTRKIIKL